MRDSYTARIRAIHVTALLANDNSSVAPQLVVASAKLDDLWSGFQVEDTAVFKGLLELDMILLPTCVSK